MLTSHEAAKIVAELRGGIAQLFPKNNIETILFGSYARGDADSESDIDVLSLVDESLRNISAPAPKKPRFRKKSGLFWSW